METSIIYISTPVKKTFDEFDAAFELALGCFDREAMGLIKLEPEDAKPQSRECSEWLV